MLSIFWWLFQGPFPTLKELRSEVRSDSFANTFPRRHNPHQRMVSIQPMKHIFGILDRFPKRKHRSPGDCLETLFFQGSFSPLRCCLSPFRRPLNWIQCHREGQPFVNISFHKKAYSDPFRTDGITTSQNVFLNICSSCSHFQRLSERAVCPVPLDSLPAFWTLASWLPS